MISREIRRLTAKPSGLSPEYSITCYVGLDSAFSIASLVASGSERKQKRLVAESVLPVRGIRGGSSDSGKYKNMYGRFISLEDFSSIISRLFSITFENSNLSSFEVDSLVIYSDAFVNNENPLQTGSLIREIGKICRGELDGEVKILNTGDPELSANEPKSRMLASGATEMISMSSRIDFRPHAFLDLSSCVSGLFLSKERREVLGLLAGLGRVVFDSLARGHSEVNSDWGTCLEIPETEGRVYEDEVIDLVSRVVNLFEVERISSGRDSVGMVPVDVEKSYERNVKLIGFDVGDDGSKLGKLNEIGREAASYGTPTLMEVIKRSFARAVSELVKVSFNEGLIDGSTGLCISSANNLDIKVIKPTIDHLERAGFKEIAEKTIFVERPETFANFASL